jgi:hypothetical protein
MTYLASRKRPNYPNVIRFYAITLFWDKETKTQKQKQEYLGSTNGVDYNFHERAQNFADLFKGTPHERAYWNWRGLQQANDNNEAVYSEQDVVNCECLCAGIDLVLGTVASRLKLNDFLADCFGTALADKILSLAYYCASQDCSPLYKASIWSRDQVLPCRESLSEFNIAGILNTIHPNQILSFLSGWVKTVEPKDRYSLDITSVSSYSTRNYDVMYGYNRDREKLPQINLLMIVSQTSKLPIWYEQLPGAISDPTTIKDTVKLLSQAAHSPLKIVVDRGFASWENISCLMKNKFKFTMGIPLSRFTRFRDMAKEAYKNNEFCDPRSTLNLFDAHDSYQTQATTRSVSIDGHRAYLHLYYTDYYKNHQVEALMSTLKSLEKKLSLEEKIKDPALEELAQLCFDVKKTPVRGVRVTPKLEQISELRNVDAGYFAILSTQFKNPNDALIAYKLRDGVEKRFDDLKNDADLKRLRMHSCHTRQSRLFVQFIAEILRCYLLNEIQSNGEMPKYVKTVTGLLDEVASIRRVSIGNHRKFYKRPTKHQLQIMQALGVRLNPNQWPSLSDLKDTQS